MQHSRGSETGEERQPTERKLSNKSPLRTGSLVLMGTWETGWNTSRWVLANDWQTLQGKIIPKCPDLSFLPISMVYMLPLWLISTNMVSLSKELRRDTHNWPLHTRSVPHSYLTWANWAGAAIRHHPSVPDQGTLPKGAVTSPATSMLVYRWPKKAYNHGKSSGRETQMHLVGPVDT